MKTTIDIPDGLLADAMRLTHAKTKREAVVRLMEDAVRRHRMAGLAQHLGTFKHIMDQDELMEMREERGKYGKK